MDAVSSKATPPSSGPVEGRGAGLPGVVAVGRESLADFEAAARREWLVTNGIGGFASGTASGARTRRYHGLLVAALDPPLGRTVLVAKYELAARYQGRRYALTSNEFGDGTIEPEGHVHIESFALEGAIPTWRFEFADAVLRQRIWMEHGRNTTFVELSLERGSATVELEVSPLVCYRDYHVHNGGGWELGVEAGAGTMKIVAFDGARPFWVVCEGADVDGGRRGWHWNFQHRVEGYRGLDDREDLFCPGALKIELAPGGSATVVATAEADAPDAFEVRGALGRERTRQGDLLAKLPADSPAWIRQLALAADQFVVRRGDSGGHTVIAGYPWFGDWGRDTMIALPGLTLAVGRPELAASILRTFAAHVSEGMLPNRFPDSGETPEYNTVDATLWYFEAVRQYVAETGDHAFAAELYPVLEEIIGWHQRGTRYGIAVDPDDGLLRAGEPGVQLTWMDAKVGDWVVTPRIGKPVEINALWHNALVTMAQLARLCQDENAAQQYKESARSVAQRFRARFWFAEGGYLFDAIDGPEGEPGPDGRLRDASLRPNQLFAVSLAPGLLDEDQSRSVVEVCARELYTSRGMRSLSPRDSRYVARYGGDTWQRDGAYHQGTGWSWLLGPFASAWYRVTGDAPSTRAWLEGLADHLSDACVGTISEIFDADAPHAPRGCVAQAWSVAEVLRAWRETSQRQKQGTGANAS